MSRLSRIFTGHWLKKLFLIACFGLLAATIWYLGPYLGFGEVRPLQLIGGRVVFLVASLLLLLGVWFGIPLFLLFAVLICAAIWVIGPYIFIGKGYPLASINHRSIAIAVVALITLAWGMWLLIRALAKNPRLLDKFTRKASVEKEDPLEHSEINAVIKGGVKYMRRIHRAVPFWRRFFYVSEWRTELPWYMVVGMQGVGKTSMVFSSGQDFPLPEQLNRTGKESQSTANCECLYTNEALFLDTAGKFMAEGAKSDQEWTLLVDALKKHRPVRAINGVIVALSASEILSGSKVELLNMAAVLRSRLDELRQKLGVHFPVYVTITRMDQLAGFDEYFRNLTAIDREQIWGVTFPYRNEEKFTQDALKERIIQELSLLECRINDAIPLRQQEEYAVNDRKRMYALPQDFRLLSQCLSEVLQNIFFASRYDETQFHSSLRGVYFLSNCQVKSVSLLNNSTLMQRWRNVINQIRPQTPASLSQKSEENGLLVPETSYGKPYFLKRLFSDVITRDRDLVSYNLRAQSAWRFKNIVGHLASLLVTIWLVWAFILSYQLNSHYLQAIATKLDALSIQASQYVKASSEKRLPALLNATQQLAQYDSLDLNDPTFEWRYGLYTGSSVFNGANSLYHYFLQRYLLPQLEDHATKALQRAITEGDDVVVYQNLKLYLILTGAGKFNAHYLVEQITAEWESSGAITPYEGSDIFIEHLNNLFSRQEWRQYGQKQDAELIKSARALLAQDSSERRIWQQIKNQLTSEITNHLSLRNITGSQTSQIFTLDDIPLLQQGIPGIYTREAFSQVKKKITTALVLFQQEASWVTGEKQAINNPLALREGVLTAYLQEYAAYWQRFLASVRLISVESQQEMSVGKGLTLDITLLRTLISDNSPLQNLLNRAVSETTLSVQDKTLAGELDINFTHSRVIQQAKKLQKVVDYREQRLVKELVDNRFSALHNFVGREQRSGVNRSEFIQPQGTQFSRVMNILSDQYTRFVMYNNAFAYGDIPPLSPESQKFAAESQIWPDPIKNIVSPLLTRSYKKLETRVIEQNVQAIDMGPGEVCRNTLQGRYPFADSDRSVSLSDFERFFASDGIVDSWFKRNLADKVDTSTHPWRFKGSNNTKGLAFFEAAATIRDAFFPDSDGKKMAMNFSASVSYLSPAITQLILNVDGENLRYSHGPVTTTDFSWPGERRGKLLSMIARKQPASALPDRIFQGPWAILRWLNDADDMRDLPDGKQLISWFIGSERIALEVNGLKYGNQSLLDLLRHFRCPDVMYGVDE
ncbi:type VI secretion system membrane subunit TssM [Enterobacteriaceae bacterium LUAb1]